MKTWRIIRTVLYLAMAVVVGIFFRTFLDNVKYVVGPLMIVYGLESVILHLVQKKKFSEENEFFWGVFEIMLGTLLLTAKDISYESDCIIWAIWSIFRETGELEEISRYMKQKGAGYKVLVGVDLAESVFAIIISITLILNPGELHVAVHTVFLIVELITTVTIPFFRDIYEKKLGKKEYFIKKKLSEHLSGSLEDDTIDDEDLIGGMK